MCVNDKAFLSKAENFDMLALGLVHGSDRITYQQVLVVSNDSNVWAHKMHVSDYSYRLVPIEGH